MAATAQAGSKQAVAVVAVAAAVAAAVADAADVAANAVPDVTPTVSLKLKDRPAQPAPTLKGSIIVSRFLALLVSWSNGDLVSEPSRSTVLP